METTDIPKFQNRAADAVRVLAFFRAKQGMGREIEKVLLALVVPTRSEPGNIAYVLHRSAGNPDELMFDEMFSSQDAFKEHSGKPYIMGLEAKVRYMLAAPIEVRVYSEIRS